MYSALKGHHFSSFMIVVTSLLTLDMLAGRFGAQPESIPAEAGVAIWTPIVFVASLAPTVITGYLRDRMREMPSFLERRSALNVLMALSVIVVPLSILSYAAWLVFFGGAQNPVVASVILEKLAVDEPVFMGLLLAVTLLIMSWYARVRYTLLFYWSLSTAFLFLSRLGFELHAVTLGGSLSDGLSLFLLLGGLFGLLALLAFWVAFALLFRHYAQRIGKKFWIVVIAPAAAALGILFVPFGVGGFNVVLFTAGFLASGLVWAIGFYLISRGVADKLVKSFFLSAAFGQIIMMISTQSLIFPIPLVTGHPAFGVVSGLFVVPSGILFFWGLYATSTYVGIDESVRRIVRKSAKEAEELRLLGKIADAEYLRQVEMKLIDAARSLGRRSGIGEEMTDQQVRYYLDLAFAERRKGPPK